MEIYTIDTHILYEEYITSTDLSTLNIGPLTAEQGEKFSRLLAEFIDLFAKDITELGRTDLVTHKIYTEDVPPIRSRPYSVAPTEQTFIKDEIQRMLDNRLIRPSNSP